MDCRDDDEEDDESSGSCHGGVVVIELESTIILTACETHCAKRVRRGSEGVKTKQKCCTYAKVQNEG